MRTNVPHIFTPSATSWPAHAGAQGGARGACGGARSSRPANCRATRNWLCAAFNARVIPSVAYTDPEGGLRGLTEDQAKAQGIKVKKGLFPGRPGPRHCQRARRRLHQAAVRRQHRKRPMATARSWRRHGRHACGRHDRRDRPGHRDGWTRSTSARPSTRIRRWRSIGMAAEVAWQLYRMCRLRASKSAAKLP